MSTGMRSTGNRGFDFSVEEGGVAMRRMQSNISERQRNRDGKPEEESGRRRSLHLLPNAMRRSLRLKKGRSTSSQGH